MHRLRPMLALPIALLLVLVAATLSFDAGPADPHAGRSPASSQPAPTRGTVTAPDTTARPTGGVAGATAFPGPTASGPIRPHGGTTPGAAMPTQIVPGTANRASPRMSTVYDVGLNLNFGTRAVTVDTILAATNTSGGPVDRLELNTVAARLGGGLKLVNVSVDGRAATATVKDQTIVLRLGGILPEGKTVKARVIYRATLRSTLGGSNWLFARTNGIANLYRWLPWVSQDVPFDRPNHGDPFVTAVSPRVTVKITTERPMVLATTGDRLAVNGLTQTFEARNVRDFAVTAAPDFKTSSRVVGGTTVRVWYRPGFPVSAALDQAAKALARMNSLVGAYPYKHYKVVQSAGGYAMEAPGLIWIPTGTRSASMPYLVHHETAHQWFYGIVGANQAHEPFTDEAAADFLARYALGAKRASRCSTARLDRSIYQYTSSCYYEIVYIQGGNFLDDLRVRMGSTNFWKGIRAYIAANRYGIASTKSLLHTLDAHTPLDLVPRYEPRFPRLY